jgi:hypothetical protein
MSATRVAALRTVLRPGRLPSGGTSRILAQTRLATTSPPDPRKQADGVQNNGPVKEFNKDGTNPNKNLAYVTLEAQQRTIRMLSKLTIGYSDADTLEPAL